MPDRVVVVEDDRELRSFLGEVMVDAGYEVEVFSTADAALEHLASDAPADLVVTDLILPGMRGHELLRELRNRRPELNVIIITAFGSIDSAIELVKAGAFDYLTKPFGTDELLLASERALEESRPRREAVLRARSAPASPPGIVGSSHAMQELFQVVRRVAPSRHPVLVTGESGTGKELIARELHRISGRAAFVAVNCAALPENLLESELFGHEKGAFTGADRERPGLFEAADGGTLFLDEIGELPLALQPKLLRALESGEFRRVGSSRTRSASVRLVAATHRNLDEEVREGRFREDLFWRLNVFHLHLPPLRERAADIPLLAEHLAQRADPGRAGAPRRISPEAMALLVAYPWPGNVRELRNALERAAALAAHDAVRAEDLPPRIRAAGHTALLINRASNQMAPLRDLERAYILEILRQTGGNKSRAADILGLDRKTLYRKLEEYGREPEDP